MSVNGCFRGPALSVCCVVSMYICVIWGLVFLTEILGSEFLIVTPETEAIISEGSSLHGAFLVPSVCFHSGKAFLEQLIKVLPL